MSRPLRLAGTATAAPNATSGSQTILQTEAGPSNNDPSVPSATLRLRASPSTAEDRRIRWAADVVDNEGMGKKSSKVCCIYHKPKEPGDSDSSDSDSSSESDSDSEPDLSRAQKAGGKGRRGRGSGDKHHKDRKPSPNAYERLPKHSKNKSDG